MHLAFAAPDMAAADAFYAAALGHQPGAMSVAHTVGEHGIDY
jgi:catechol 2,3-dioxygenase-like lactoylglutathione lyase family enzyme